MNAPLPSVCATLVLLSVPGRAQESALDPGRFGVVYDVPATARVKLDANVTYWKSGERELQLDLYLPPDAGAAPLPAVVFLNAIGDRPPDRLRQWGIYRTWPRLVAAHGLVGIAMDCDGAHVQESLTEAFRFLEREGAAHGVDAGRLGVYAASANVRESERYLMGADCARGIRAAALFYGWPTADEPRRDLPVLCILSEGDAAHSSEAYEALWPRVMAARAPWTLQYASGLPHAFDALSDSDASRRVIQQALAFWKSHLEPVPQPPWAADPARAVVEASYWGDSTRLLPLLGDWILAHPTDASAYAQRGTHLARVQRGREARPDLEKALELGSNDPGVRGCLGMILAFEGQHERAIELLEGALTEGWGNGQTLGALAHSELLLGRNEDAVRDYERALQQGVPPGDRSLDVATYNLACGYARLGRIDEALTAVERAVELRFGSRAAYESDLDLAPLRDEERFQQALERLSSPR